MKRVSIRLIAPIVACGLLLLSYQNCAPPGASGDGSSPQASVDNSGTGSGAGTGTDPNSNPQSPLMCDTNTNNRPTLLGYGPSRSFADLTFQVYNGQGGSSGDQGIQNSAIPTTYFASNETEAINLNQTHILALGVSEQDIGGVEDVLDLDEGNATGGGATSTKFEIDIDGGRGQSNQCKSGTYRFSVHVRDICPPQNDDNELRSTQSYNVIVNVSNACMPEDATAPTDVSSSNYLQQQVFGVDVDLTSNRAFVAASSGPGADYRVGAVYAYNFSSGSSTLSHVEKLIPPADGYSAEGLMSSVSGNGSMVVAGLPRAGSNDGGVYVWNHDGSSWSQDQRLTPVDAGTAGNGQRFGQSVAISPNGNSLAIGAPFDSVSGVANRGSVYIYSRSGNTWVYSQRVTASEGAAGDFFGLDVALSDSTLVVGAPGGVPGFSPNVAGKLYSYALSGFVETRYAAHSSLHAYAQLGFSVDISGSRIAVGAPYYDGNQSDANDDDGRAFIYTVGNANSAQEITSQSDGERFGYAVAVDGNDVIVGAPRNSNGNGKNYYYRASNLSQSFEVRARDRRDNAEFGNAIDISNGHSLTGAWLMRVVENEVGKAYLNELSSTNFPWD